MPEKGQSMSSVGVLPPGAALHTSRQSHFCIFQFFDQTVNGVLGTVDEMQKELEGPQHSWRLQQQYQVSGRYFPSDQAAVADQLQDR